jgi:protein arginine N-methyltransferase 1
MSTNYSVGNYNEMITDTVRIAAYRQALRKTVAPGSVVAEIGTGNGYFAVFACMLGARKVIAVEANPVIHVAMEVAEHNGVTDKIEFHHAISTSVMPSEPADVLISDMRGALPLFRDHIASIRDARSRFLKPGGKQIPERDDLYACFVSGQQHLKYYVEPPPIEPDTPSLTPTLWRIQNSWGKTRIKPEECVGDAVHLGTLDYRTIESPHFAANFGWNASERKQLHGFCVWFDTVLTEDIGFSNSPHAQEAIYGQAFFPFPEELTIEPGEIIEVAFRMMRTKTDDHYEWNTSIKKEDSSELKAMFSQSTLRLEAMPYAQLRRMAGHYIPSPTKNQEMLSFVLSNADGNNSLDDITGNLVTKFPDAFPNRLAARNFVGESLEKTR